MTLIIDVNVLIGPPGCGKTSKLMNEMLAQPGQYLFSMPRSDLIDERVRDLQARTTLLGISPIIVPIHSGQTTRIPVRRRVKDAAHVHAGDEHVIVLVTHEAMKTSDLGGYVGWAVRIDEPPDAVASDNLRIPASWRWFATVYDLVPVPDTKWSRVQLRPDAPSLRDILRDDITEDLATFHKFALSSHGVYVDVSDWEEAITRRKVQWWAAWTPLELAHFASIKIAGSGYLTSLLHLANEAWYPGQIRCHRHEVGVGRTAWPSVRIHYFTRGHRASTAFWNTDQGRACLNKVGRYLAGVGLGYWTGNDLVRQRFEMSVSGLMVSPKQAGTNEYRHLTSCAAIYSNKLQASDAPLVEVFDLSREDIERARQIEDIEQFIMRGAIRCPDFGGEYDIHVYDQWQAESVMQFLQRHGIADVELIGHDEVGIMDEERPKPGRKPSGSNPEVLKLKAEERREADRLRKQRDREEERLMKSKAGTLRSPGRPRKQAA